ncbi:WXG100 family type VII secretion target [Nocardia acidivorans]|uniref:WXG100 family type VII secretion target n=1 Tax=Nocardia acidivorans TaxID=404580 RepID=UPI00082CAF5B|nr:WXG100 family type VII secretion target [Nocardia acidivorans]
MSEEGGSGSLFVVPEDVQALGRSALDIAETMRSALKSAGREVDSLTTTGWTGTAATSFGTGWGECSDGGHRIIDALTTMADQLGVTAETYVGHDLLSADQFTNLDLS